MRPVRQAFTSDVVVSGHGATLVLLAAANVNANMSSIIFYSDRRWKFLAEAREKLALPALLAVHARQNGFGCRTRRTHEGPAG